MQRASQQSLKIENLFAGIEGKEILRGVNLQINPGKITALMGPNGSGKSTLSHVLMGHPDYVATRGKVWWQQKNILRLEPWQKARLGLFLAFQYPHEVPGVNMYEFLLTAYKAVAGTKQSQKEFDRRLKIGLHNLDLKENFLERSLNEGFSGGEKKKAEILQLHILQPKLAILDETDSGLDIDALKIIAKNIKKLISPKLGVLVITHYQRLLNYLKPNVVHIMLDGKIVKTGGTELVKKLEKQGYAWLKK